MDTAPVSRARRIALLVVALAVVLITAAGCGEAARVFLDLPPAGPKPPRSPEPKAVATTTAAASAVPAQPELPPPLLETSLDPDSILRWLPRDHAGNADWVAALKQGLYRPRASIEMLPAHEVDIGAAPFAFDFWFPNDAPDSLMDAFFPHSVHTAIIDCRQCHGPVMRYKDNKIQMSDILDGQFCGKCHGKVAFNPINACERCHSRLEMPEMRSEPELLGTITMTRHASDSSYATGVGLDSLPPARFPHWVHRIRYQCKVCHNRIFEPTAGANVIRMADINKGRACGTCHNGRVAFRAGFGECQRCHVREPVVAEEVHEGE
jgi:c(7)-type cytochrome triheme protein